ncbi:CAP domain-containing protein [Bacillus sp. FJAT-27445]|uniref:CAP domain-containing protein n=1 Tax=Bacillus sp. FJAT-27445 TaxID=1679166 RepID=UPI000743C380|nr:CAP domain-containing protein [Bacillus sp. FJAT-27445]
MVLKALLRILILSTVFLTIGFYVSQDNTGYKDSLIREEPVPEPEKPAQKQKGGATGYGIPDRPDKGLSILIGKTVAEVEKVLGNPQRIDKSSYDYDWYIYNLYLDKYIQVGVLDNKAVTIYAMGRDTNVAPFAIGNPLEEIFTSFAIHTNITIDYGGNAYRLELNDTDVNTMPLIQLGDIFAQLYIDKFNGSLSSVRFLDAETLIKQRPYEVAYRGTLIEAKALADEDWQEVEVGAEKQIFDLSNVLRVRHGLEPLKWDEKTAQAAYGHSVDMYETNSFSHISKEYGNLSDRLKKAKVVYQAAGENIAANYIDAPAVVEGWLNSKGHRESLLNGDFTHLGVGVYRKYYTQNFIQKWLE